MLTLKALKLRLLNTPRFHFIFRFLLPTTLRSSGANLATLHATTCLSVRILPCRTQKGTPILIMTWAPTVHASLCIQVLVSEGPLFWLSRYYRGQYKSCTTRSTLYILWELWHYSILAVGRFWQHRPPKCGPYDYQIIVIGPSSGGDMRTPKRGTSSAIARRTSRHQPKLNAACDGLDVRGYL